MTERLSTLSAAGKANRAKLARLVAQRGCTMDAYLQHIYCGATPEITIDAPDGFQFEGGLHQLVASLWDDQSVDELVLDMLERFAQTEIDPCPTDCDCHPTTTEN